ncbi:MAG TPA: TetR/AcrR family transcriptional regulator [Paenibacillaceae bacterium]
MDKTQSTKTRLMEAAIDLMAEKGYDGTTTKEIAAAAGVNEITLFRHFGSKQQLLEQAVKTYHYGDEMTSLFNESLTGDLHADLLLISQTYHRIMNRNRKLLSIALKGSSKLPEEVYEEMRRHPRILRDLLTRYLTDMVEKKKAVTPNPEMTALSFMWMNYGAFVSSLDTKFEPQEKKLPSFIEESVRLFARALTP